jgi:hypothetical protein
MGNSHSKGSVMAVSSHVGGQMTAISNARISTEQAADITIMTSTVEPGGQMTVVSAIIQTVSEATASARVITVTATLAAPELITVTAAELTVTEKAKETVAEASQAIISAAENPLAAASGSGGPTMTASKRTGPPTALPVTQAGSMSKEVPGTFIEQPTKGPFTPGDAILGGIPTPGLDVPITVVFLILFITGATTHFTIHELNGKRGHKFHISDMVFDFCMVRTVTCTMRIVWAFRTSNNSIVLAALIFENAG